jgi:hypothetical protein
MLWAKIFSASFVLNNSQGSHTKEERSVVVRIAGMSLRILFVINLLLGLLFWFNVTANDALVLLHMLVGILFVACIWLLGLAQGMTKAGSLGLVIGTFVTGLVIAIFGMAQIVMLQPDGHWIVEVIHLLLAIAGIGIGEVSMMRYNQGVAASVANTASAANAANAANATNNPGGADIPGETGEAGEAGGIS